MDTEDWMVRGGKRATSPPPPSRKRPAAKKTGGSAGSSIVSTLSTEGPKLLAPFGLLLARQGGIELGKHVRKTKTTSGGDGGLYDMLRRASINGGGAPARTAAAKRTAASPTAAAKRTASSPAAAAKRTAASPTAAAKRIAASPAAAAAKRTTATSSSRATAQKQGGGPRALQGQQGRDRETEKHIKEQFDMLVGGLGEILGGGSAAPRTASAKTKKRAAQK